MKVNGISFEGPKAVPCVIPVGDQEIPFLITPVLDYEEFDTLCPRPTPPGGIDNKGKKTQDVNHPSYLKAIGKWADMRMDWMYLKALEETEGLEWETIQMNNPETFENFTKELQEAGIPDGYIESFKLKIIQVCGLDPNRIDEATKRFLATQEQEQEK